MRSHLENYELKQDDKTNMPLIRTNVTGDVHKTSTCLLLDSEKNVISFGSKAEQDYKKLLNDGNHTPYYFFKHFKSGFNEVKYIINDNSIMYIILITYFIFYSLTQ